MKRADELSHKSFSDFDYEKFIQIKHSDGDISYLSRIENKENSFGILDGNIVAIDYA